MAITTWNASGVNHFLTGDGDWVAGAYRVSLHGAAYTPNQNTHDFFDDATAELATGGGYTAGGLLLTGKALAFDATSQRWQFTADPFAINPSTLTARWAVVRRARGGLASADNLLATVDLEGTQTTSGTPFEINWPASGVVFIDITLT